MESQLPVFDHIYRMCRAQLTLCLYPIGVGRPEELTCLFQFQLYVFLLTVSNFKDKFDIYLSTVDDETEAFCCIFEKETGYSIY